MQANQTPRQLPIRRGPQFAVAASLIAIVVAGIALVSGVGRRDRGETRVDSTNARSPNGYPALHFGVRMNYENIVEKLISAGGNVEIGNNSEYTGDVDETALHCAAFWDRYEIAKRLIDAGANVNALTKRKSTPLHSAARMTNVSLARLLLESGAKIDARDEDGQTPLDWCSELKWTNADEIEKLLREYRAKNDE